MKKILIIFVLGTALNCKSQNNIVSNEINVLFIGNSFTYFHDMPQTVQAMINETNPYIKIEQITFPGMSLSDHLTNIITSKSENGIATRLKVDDEKTETEIKLTEKRWDIVVLQTGTVSVLIPESRELKINKAIAEIKKLVANPNCKFILFQTWPSKNKYPEQYCYPSNFINEAIKKEKYCSPIFEDLEQEYAAIDAAYNEVANNNNLVKSNNGSKYFEVLLKHTEIELYEDESHPNANGSFLNACIFYQLLMGMNASNLKYNGKIEPKLAAELKRISE